MHSKMHLETLSTQNTTSEFKLKLISMFIANGCYCIDFDSRRAPQTRPSRMSNFAVRGQPAPRHAAPRPPFRCKPIILIVDLSSAAATLNCCNCGGSADRHQAGKRTEFRSNGMRFCLSIVYDRINQRQSLFSRILCIIASAVVFDATFSHIVIFVNKARKVNP